MQTIFFSESAVAYSISSADGTLLEYRLSLQARPALESLSKRARLGLVMQSRDQSREALQDAIKKTGLFSFDPELVFFTDELTENAFTEERDWAPETSLFVDQDCTQRAIALRLGFAAAVPHPLLVSDVLDGAELIYARVAGIKSERLLGRLTELPIVPFHVTTDHQGSAYLITTPALAEKIRVAGLEVKIFDQKHDPQRTDPYLARDDRPLPGNTTKENYATDFLKAHGKADFIVDAVDRSLLLALPENVPIEEIHFPKAVHGHNRRLLVNKELLRSFTGTFFRMQTEIRPNFATDFRLNDNFVPALMNGITFDRIKELHAPYVGDAVLPSTGILVESRHVSHPHNEAVTQALCRHLDAIGQGQMTPARRQDFHYKGQPLSNVIADLPGTLNESWVIVSAHLDATARNDGVDNPAPGADDDASGMAGVLATAEVAVALRRAGEQFQHGLRFIFFNAEEDVILGSYEYVLSLTPNVNIVGVFQMDMIGYTGGTLQTEFEVHTGCDGNVQAETSARELAWTIEGVKSQVSTVLNRPQIYPLSKGGFDPSFGRSDHVHFQMQNYAACMITEDQNEGPLTPPPQHRINGAYHRRTDKNIDYGYAAEIARVVAAAAILKARG